MTTLRLVLPLTLLACARVAAQQGGAAAPPAAPAPQPWPALEPFKESRFWDLASRAVREQGLTRDVLASMDAEFGGVRDATAEASAAADIKPPKDILLGQAVPEARKIWFWEVPVVLDALAPLWTAPAWDDAQLARARVAADFFGGQKGPPPLTFAAGNDAANHAQLEHLAAWFRAESAKPESYALMIVTDDDGPWLPQKAKSSSCKSARSRALDDRRTLVICKQDKEGDPWRIQLLEKDKALWTRTLTQVPSDAPLRFEGDPKPLGPHGWIVPLDFGEYTALYLDAKAEPLFYFTSW